MVLCGMADSEVSRLVEALLALDRLATEDILNAALSRSDLVVVADRLIVPALEEIGRRWADGVIALSEEYMSSRICENWMDTLSGGQAAARPKQPKLAVVALKDYHVLGKKLVTSVLRSSGFEVTDYGQGVEIDDLVARVEADRIDMLFVSTLMLPSALAVKQLSVKLHVLGLQVKLIVGGAPFRFDPKLSDEVGADGMGLSASDVVSFVKKWMARA